MRLEITVTRFFAALLLLGVVASHSAFADGTLVTIKHGDVTLSGDRAGPDDAPDGTPVVLLVHGTLAHKDMQTMQSMQAALTDRGVASIAINLSLGLGTRDSMYPCEQPHTHTMQDAVSEIKAWVAWLNRSGAKPFVLGHSRGGAQVAWAISELDPSVISGVVLLAPAYERTAQERAASYKSRFKADLAPVIAKAKASVSAGKPDTMMSVPGFLYCADTKAAAASIVSYYEDDMRRDSPTMAAKITAPVLVIAGGNDTVVPDVAMRFSTLAATDAVAVHTVADAGHMFLDFYAEDAADLITEFIGAAAQ